MSRRSAINQQLRKENKPEILEFCKDNGLDYRWVQGDWHIRIENVLDVYPTRKKYFWLPDKQWGEYDNYEDLGQIFANKMETK